MVLLAPLLGLPEPRPELIAGRVHWSRPASEEQEREGVREEAQLRVTTRLLDLLAPPPVSLGSTDENVAAKEAVIRGMAEGEAAEQHGDGH